MCLFIIAVIVLCSSSFAASPAEADYAPSTEDVVGVGVDILQYAVDFLADGDYVGDPGFNTNSQNKLISFDAFGDSNGRLLYGPGGLSGVQSGARDSVCTLQCSPGTGVTVGTGNDNSSHAEVSAPCSLNPTIILRAGLKPVKRPNGSGAGINALKADVSASAHNIDFVRASAPQVRGSTAAYDSVQLGTDTLAMLVSSTTNAPAGGVTAAQLKYIYQCIVGYTDWNALNPSAPVGSLIYPILPQVGSGTRSSFLNAIGLTEASMGACVANAEENDPAAIDASGNPANAIEPMSSGRLAMYRGQDSTGASLGTGYFLDPSCRYAVTTPAKCTTAGTGGITNVLNPNVTYQFGPTFDTNPGSTGSAAATASGSATIALSGQTAAIVVDQPVSGTGIPTGTTVASVSGTFPNQTITLSTATTANTPAGTIITAFSTGAFSVTRAMYIYFRDADVNGTTIFQPGGTRNWVRTLFYNPCSGTTPIGEIISVASGNCTFEGIYGPGGPPFVASSNGQSLISASGITPTYASTLGGP